VRAGVHVTASYKRSSTAYEAQKEADEVGNDLSNKVRCGDAANRLQTNVSDIEGVQSR
jgi:hypothetical protein